MSRTTRRYQENSYIVTTDRNTYCVVLERRHNTLAGAPRYHAVLCILDNTADGAYCYNIVYNFTGHCLSALDECRWIVTYYETNNLPA